MTGFKNRCDILGSFWDTHRDKVDWESLMDTLELEDTGFSNLNDVFLASGMDV
jgi:hypothetical protein